MTQFPNDTHPEAKTFAERASDDRVWAVAFTNPLKPDAPAFVVTRNGDDVAGPMHPAMARQIVRLHNQAL